MKPNRFQKARAIVTLDGVRVNTRDKKDRIKDAFVNGSQAKKYNVILKRNRVDDGIVAECLLETPNGTVDCPSAAYIVCYHTLATIILSAKERGKEVAFCDSEECANRRVNLGGEIYKVYSQRNLDWCNDNGVEPNPVWVVVS